MRRKNKTGVRKKACRPSVEEYMRMSEEEKDLAIQRAVMRLQTRIQEILFLLDRDRFSADSIHGRKEVMQYDKDHEADSHGPGGDADNDLCAPSSGDKVPDRG